jgi:hypothetical protein
VQGKVPYQRGDNRCSWWPVLVVVLLVLVLVLRVLLLLLLCATTFLALPPASRVRLPD